MSRKKKNKNGPIITMEWSPTEEELTEFEANHNKDMQSHLGKLMLNKYDAYTSDADIARIKGDI